MAYQALYRKYRPHTFSDVVGQEHITETLKNELRDNKTVHAYLFTGTRGTGKTSCAKILAAAVNCLNLQNGDPCLECESCKSIINGENTDVVEIDAASNNSVDCIRELREQIAFTPSNSKYRVYIIDEVHMLTISAFNALLKTLEEPPEHVVFILATTEVYKLPATILSRCQRFDFKRIDAEKIESRIQYIANKEGFTVTNEAASLIASVADGGMRDALSVLDLCASGSKEITEAVVENVCSMAGNDYLLKLADYIKDGDTEKALLLLDDLHNSSVDMLRLLSDLTTHYRNLMIIKTVKTGKLPIVCSVSKLEEMQKQAENYSLSEIMRILSVLQSCASTIQNGNRRCEMEMAIITLCNPKICTDISSLEKRVSALEKRPLYLQKDLLEESVEIIDENPSSIVKQEEVNESIQPESEKDDTVLLVENWNDIIINLKSSCPLIAGVLEKSKAYISGQFLLIDAPNTQFKSLVNSGNSLYRDSIRKAAAEVLGKTYKLGPYISKKERAVEDPLADLADKLKQFNIN